jgi:hypothetical protein
MDLSNRLIKKGMKKTKSQNTFLDFSVFRSFEDERSSKTNEERVCTNIKSTNKQTIFFKNFSFGMSDNQSQKVKECTACGQGFDEGNNEVGRRIGGRGCADGHDGPFVRINLGKHILS